ncbi:MAG TPA: prolyl oligopeptidase family serine peptidase [Candidatus Baltobacteraceae bacterium]|jgi:dipeptidyl aminopeptidase/acylaminoacyl peptidase|nr:prolyl oligopeptidase family serine peptidase [Candidatus Baltobacteraceae bacterium]
MIVRRFAALLAFVFLIAQSFTAAAVAPGSGTTAIPLKTYLSLTDVAWISASPDGSHVAYTSKESGTWQVWTARMDGSHRRHLTSSADGADGDWWIPNDPHTILFTSSHGGSGIDQMYAIRDDRPGVTLLIPHESKVTHVFGAFSPDGSKIAFSSNRRNQQAFDVYVLDRKTGRTRRVYTSAHSAYATAWSPNANELLVQVVYSPYNADLYTVELRSGAARLITPHTGLANFDSSQFTPDMHGVVCISDLQREFHTIQRIDLATRSMRPVIDLPYDIDQVVLSPDAQHMAYIVNRDGYGDVVVADAAGRTIGTPSMPPSIAEALTFARGGRLLLYNASGPTFPKVTWSYDIDTHKTTQILHPNFHGIPPDSMVDPPLVHVRSFDGTMVPAWYFAPKHHTGKLTVLLDIHGGPEDQDRVWFYPFAQYLVSRGYALLDPNIRGSDGYGRTYLHGADGRKREDALKDVEALRKWLVTSGNANPKNVFIDGASYGGYVVLASLYHYPYAYAGGMDIYGVADWVKFLQNTGEVRSARESIYGSLAHDRSFLESISPINHVSQITRPVLIVAGKNDTIVPVSQSERMAAAIRKNGVPVDLHIFPNEGHGISSLTDLMALYDWMTAFMDRHSTH